LYEPSVLGEMQRTASANGGTPAPPEPKPCWLMYCESVPAIPEPNSSCQRPVLYWIGVNGAPVCPASYIHTSRTNDWLYPSDVSNPPSTACAAGTIDNPPSDAPRSSAGT
jgi:hypothetical protein